MSSLKDAAAKLGFTLERDKVLPSGTHQVSFLWTGRKGGKVHGAVCGRDVDEVYHALAIRCGELTAQEHGLPRGTGRLVAEVVLGEREKGA